MPTVAVGIEEAVGIARGPGYPDGDGLLTASIYADGLTAAVGIDATSSIRVARHVIDPRRSPVRGVANLCRRPGRRHRSGPWMLPRHRSAPMGMSMPTALPSAYLHFLIYIFFNFLFILFTFSCFFHNINVPYLTKKHTQMVYRLPPSRTLLPPRRAPQRRRRWGAHPGAACRVPALATTLPQP